MRIKLIFSHTAVAYGASVTFICFAENFCNQDVDFFLHQRFIAEETAGIVHTGHHELHIFGSDLTLGGNNVFLHHAAFYIHSIAFYIHSMPRPLTSYTLSSVKGTYAKLTRFHPDHTEEMKLSHMQKKKSIGIDRH
jgi:hypothetical protein